MPYCYTLNMQTLSQEQFNRLLKTATIRPRLKADIRFVKSIEKLPDDWSDLEIVAISDKTGDKGILLLQPENDLYIVEYELSRKIADSSTGRMRAVICDFCYTWQSGSNAASILFTIPDSKSKIGFLCCGDLRCSDHVRTLTKASLLSRSQLREDMTNEDRVERLRRRLAEKVERLGLRKL